MTPFAHPDLRQRRSGILLHPTSLPGPHGSGDLGPSAQHFVDWLAHAGMRVWQVLPLNPIGPGNSPYASVSAFACNPLLVALEPLQACGWLDLEAPPDFPSERVDFEHVVPWRIAQLRRAWAGFQKQATEAERSEWATYCQAQAHWLDDYALFMVIDAAQQAQHGWRAWPDWDPPLAQRDARALSTVRREQADEYGFWCFTQWCFERQWSALRHYAAAKDIRIIGDLPIFVAHHSADCWARPDLYQLDAKGFPTEVAGVPPDFFSPTGQRWGNPLYRWERFQAEGFNWWIDRMRRQLALADIVRIDHFRGFVSYWAIPADSPDAVSGRWVPAPGLPLFESIHHALGPLPVIAEDLGLITPDVEALREALGLPGMRIAQFGFSADADHPFLPHNYPSDCVAYTGTHDNDTLRGWWHSATERERQFASAYLRSGEDRLHIELWRALLASAAAMVVLPLQDALGLDGRHRFNTPGQIGAWEWRFDWSWVPPHRAAELARDNAAFGRAAPSLLALPDYPNDRPLP